MTNSNLYHYLLKQLKENHYYEQLTITWQYRNRAVEFMGRKKGGKEYKGIAKLNGSEIMIQESPSLPLISGERNCFKLALDNKLLVLFP